MTIKTVFSVRKAAFLLLPVAIAAALFAHFAAAASVATSSAATLNNDNMVSVNAAGMAALSPIRTFTTTAIASL